MPPGAARPDAGGASEETLAEIKLVLLGGFEIEATAPIRLTSRKARALLACLALRPGEPWPRERLAALLWDDSPEDLARSSLRQALAALRRALAHTSASEAVIADPEAVVLEAAALDSDVAELRAALARGGLEDLSRMAARHRGDLLEGFDARSNAFDDWLRAERSELRRQVLGGLRTLHTLATAQNNQPAAEAALARWVALDPTDECARRKAMEAHARQGRTREALEEYQRLRELLRRDLGVDPEPATEALRQQIVRQRQQGPLAVTSGKAEDAGAPPDGHDPAPGSARGGPDRAPERLLPEAPPSSGHQPFAADPAEGSGRAGAASPRAAEASASSAHRPGPARDPSGRHHPSGEQAAMDPDGGAGSERGAPAARAAAGGRQEETTLREATVLAARLAGLPAEQATLDPERAGRLALEFQGLVAETASRFGGVSDRLMGSDVITVFGPPATRGNENERAVRAALALLRAVKAQRWPEALRGSLQLGLDMGQLLGRRAGSGRAGPAASDPDGLDGSPFPLAGRPLSQALALAGRAGPSEILASASLARSLGARLQVVRSDGEAGIAQAGGAAAEGSPVCIAGLREPGPLAAAGAAPLAGRQSELAMATAMLERVGRAQSGQVLVVRGEPGIGKTRLLAAVAEAAQRQGVAVLAAGCQALGPASSSGLLAGLTRVLLDRGQPSTGRAPAPAAPTLQPDHQAGVGPEQRLFLRELLEVGVGEELADLQRTLDPAARQRGRSAALGNLLRAAAAAPLCLIVEDLHWASPDELATLLSAAGGALDLPLLLLLSVRSEGAPALEAAWRARMRGAPLTTFELGPLSDAEGVELAETLTASLGPAGLLSPDAARACVQRAAGHPLFLEQLLRAAAAGEATLPGSIRAVVVARFEQLPEAAGRTLQAAAVLGPRFTLPALRFVSEAPAPEVDRLVAAGLLTLDWPTAGADLEVETLAFSHALFQEAIQASLLRDRRSHLHLRAAAFFAEREPTRAADHLAAAEDPRAARAYLDAARDEARAQRTERALACAERARQLAAEPELRRDAALLAGELSLASGRTHQALAAYREALDFSTGDPARAEALLGAAGALRLLDRWAEALETVRRAEPLVPAQDAATLARLWTLRGNLHFPLGQLDACLAAHQEAHRQAQRTGSPVEAIRTLGGLGDAYYQRGQLLTAVTCFQACVDQARRHDQPDLLLAYLPMLGVSRAYTLELATGRAECTEAQRLAAASGQLRAELVASICLASLAAWQGDAPAALAAAERGLDLARRLGAPRFEAETLALGALALAGSGERGPAVARLRAAWNLSRDTGPTYCGPLILGALALFTARADEREGALAEGQLLAERSGLVPNQLEFHALAIDACLDAGRPAEARAQAEALARATRAEPLPWAELVVRRGLALAAWPASPDLPPVAEAAGDPRAQLTWLHGAIAAAGLRPLLARIEAALSGSS